MKLDDTKIKKYFLVDTEYTVDFLLKDGIQRTYEKFARKAMKSKIPADEIRDSIVTALDTLTQVQLPTGKVIRPKEKEDLMGQCFFSSTEDALIEFFVNKNVDNQTDAQAFDMDNLPNQKPERSPKETMNIKFRAETTRFLEARVGDEIQDVIFAGVDYVLYRAQDFAGPYVQTFKELMPLFAKLGRIYAKGVGISSSKGCYSLGMAVDEDLTDRRAELDEDDFGWEG